MSVFLKNLFSLNAPTISLRVVEVCGVIMLVLFVISFFMYRNARGVRKQDKMRSQGMVRLGRWFLWAGVVIMVWTFFAYERISIFGGSVWLTVFGVIWLAWLAHIAWYFVKIVPVLSAAAKERAAREKYLPRSRK